MLNSVIDALYGEHKKTNITLPFIVGSADDEAFVNALENHRITHNYNLVGIPIVRKRKFVLPSQFKKVKESELREKAKICIETYGIDDKRTINKIFDNQTNGCFYPLVLSLLSAMLRKDRIVTTPSGNNLLGCFILSGIIDKYAMQGGVVSNLVYPSHDKEVFINTD